MIQKKIKIIFAMPTLLIFGFTFSTILFFQINQTNAAISCNWKNGCSYGEYIHGTPSGNCITTPKPDPSNSCCCNEAAGTSLPTPAIDCSTMLVTDINYYLCIPPLPTTESNSPTKPKMGASRGFELNDNTPKLQIPIPNLTFSPSTCKINDKGENVCSVAWIGEYIAGVYKYAIGIVGILAAVVLMIGGVIWIVAGGSATMIGEAKAWIGASLTGLVIALCSYLILFQINPALTVFAPLGITQVAKAPEAPMAGGCQWGEKDVLSCSSGYDKTSDVSKCPAGGKPFEQLCCCPKLTAGTGGCAEANFNGTCFAADSAKAACICQKESSGNAAIESGTDHCTDGTSWSIGLWQINIADSHGGATECGGAGGTGGIKSGGNTPLPQAGGKTCLDSNTTMGCCLERKTGSNGINYCSIRNCYKEDANLYNTCSTYLKNTTNNTTTACKLYNSRGWTPWLNSASLCQ